MNFSLANQFLIAMPGMQDPYFTKSVTLICEHSEKGALGFVINQPTQLTVSELLSQQNIEFDPEIEISEWPLYSGGPVDPERGFILHSSEKSWETTMRIGDAFGITSSKDIIEDSVSGQGPDKSLYILGYSGWEAGQLEQEISDNAWLTIPADPNIIFNLPAEKRWRSAASEIGVDLDLINLGVGHA